MKNISAKNNNATVCVKNNCMTVHGETAQFVNYIAIAVAIMIAVTAFAVMAKHLK